MKNIHRNLIVAILLTMFTGFGITLNAQGPPPPPSDHGSTTNQQPAGNGGSAPIGGGIAILVALAAGYAGKKIYDNRNE